MRVLCYNQGAAKAGMLGAASFDAALAASLEDAGDLRLERLTAEPSSPAQRLAQRPWPWLGALDLDLHTPRWHLVESAKARRSVLASLERSGDPDVLLVNTQSVSFRLGDVMRRIPTVLSVDVPVKAWHDMGIWRRPRRYSDRLLASSIRAETDALGDAALVLAWSRWAAEQVQRQQPRANVAHHHPGIDTTYYRPAERRPRRRPAVLFIGGRFKPKGGALLVEALAPSLGTDLDLHVVTGEALAERPGLVQHRLGPGDPALLDLLQQCDLLCLPTRGDASPWVILEAMACGTPVLASAVGAIPEMLAGGAGELCSNSDVRDLRHQVMAVLAHADRRRDLADQGLAQVHARYNAQRQGAVLGDLLRSCARTGRR